MRSPDVEPASTPLFVGLDDAVCQDRAVVGGKAAALARVRAAGLPVPEGFVIPCSVVPAALAAAGVDVEAPRSPAAWRALLRDLPLPTGWTATWAARAARLGGPGGRLAVRSSARGEDGAAHAHAGMYTSVLGVTDETLGAAVRQVWSSLYTDAAIVYRGGPPQPDEMAVLVQAMVPTTSAGVMFTTHPLTGSWRELVVEAVWGLGEALVSGRATPQAWVVRRPRRLPRGLLRLRSRLELAVTSADPPVQAMWTPPDGGPCVPLPARLHGRDVLDTDGVLALARLGLKLERALGAPQDVEWTRTADGRFVVVQARPITARSTPPSAQPVLWTRRFVGERWHEPATPLGWSLVAPVLAWFIAYPRTQDAWLGGGPALQLVDGRPYVNATVFRHLMFKLPGAPLPGFLAELLGPDEARAWRGRHAALPDLRVLASLLSETWQERRWTRFAWNPATNPSAWQAFDARAQRTLARLGPAPADPRDAVARVTELVALVQAYVGVHVTSLLFANLCWQGLRGALDAALPTRAAALHAALAVSPPGNATLVANRALWHLARAAAPGDLGHLAAGTPVSTAFADALAAFLATHGHRATASWEVWSPRWRTHPDRLVPLLRAARADPVDPDVSAARRAADADAALAEVARDAPALGLPVLMALVWYTRRYLLLRENQRDAFDRITDALATTLRALGATLVARGDLDSVDDLAFLAWPEVVAAVEGTCGDLRPTLARRRNAHARASAHQPPVVLSGQDVPAALGRRLQGHGTSPGRHEGPARVLASVDEAATLQPGEVLVTHALDPSWTPLLRVAGAVVVELGGALSHGAVVAREYGVPMVADVPGVGRQITTGERLTVDGTRGLVWRHPPGD
ncbi:MAG: hypothetical protein H6733_14955 [Alphaproteobacteria bacterium]|nr:hypothetical protein [Alphaproteobacteria bacterium]